MYEKFDYQLRNLGEQILSTTSQEELKFLTLGMPDRSFGVHLTYYLIEKHRNAFNQEIENAIADSFVSTFQDAYKFPPIDGITFKQALAFTYLSFMAQERDFVLEDILRHIKILYCLYQKFHRPLKFEICHELSAAGVEFDIIKRLETIATEIIGGITDYDTKYLSEAPDRFIMVWLFSTRWVSPENDYGFVEKIEDEKFIDEKMLDYLIKKYNLLFVWVDDFKFALASTYVATQLKNSNKTLDDRLQMLGMFDSLVRPKQVESLDEASLESPTDCKASENKDEDEGGDTHD
jgi:hypothetical protein